jgi:hypothetical protein
VDPREPRHDVRLTLDLRRESARTTDEFAGPAGSIQTTAPKADGPQKQEVKTMAASIWVEEESGTYSGRVHPHNGYYATDFSSLRHDVPSASAYASARTA